MMTTEMLKRVLNIRYAVPWPAGCGSPCAAIAAPQARITIRAISSIDSVPLLYGNEWKFIRTRTFGVHPLLAPTSP